VGVIEPKLLEIVQSGRPEPGVDGGEIGLGADVKDAEAAARAEVGGKDVRYNTCSVLRAPMGEVTTVEVKRGGAPEMAPPGREDLGAASFLGGEERDDVAEDGIGEVADAVGASSVIPAHAPPSPPPPPL
jgi:hypothetical protein